MSYLYVHNDVEHAYFKLDDVISIHQILEWDTDCTNDIYEYVGLQGEYYSPHLPVYKIVTKADTYFYVNAEIDIISLTGLIESLG